MSNPLFDPIAKHRISERNPPRKTDDLDVERCAALHNTLMLYGWVCSGKRIPEMPKKSWWSKHGSQSLQRLLRPSLVRYLAKIFDVPNHNFFYHISGLARPPEMLQLGDVLEDNDHDPLKAEKYRFVVIYAASKELVSFPAGVVYDQQKSRALLMATYNHVPNLRDPSLPWQPLETILSAYFDMVDGEKAVAVHDSFDPESEVKTPKTDMAIGGRVRFQTRPWVLQPYTLGDLTSSLTAWKNLIEAIESRAGILDPNTDPESEPLCTRAALTVAGIPKGFAYDLLLRAQQSQIWFIAPGIRLPKVEEFVHQPFKSILEAYPNDTKGMKMPFLFLRCPGEVSAKDAKFRWPFSTLASVPCGLYLDAFPNAQNPFEDACRLVLPIRLGANRYARTSDFRPIRKTHSDLYQVELNPFVMRHGPKLVAILENWLENVERGHWAVNDKGVSGGVGMWRQADSREDWWRYQAKHLSI